MTVVRDYRHGALYILPDYWHNVRRTVLQHVTIRRTVVPALWLAVVPDYRHYDNSSQSSFVMMTVTPSSKPVCTYKCAAQIHREILHVLLSAFAANKTIFMVTIHFERRESNSLGKFHAANIISSVLFNASW